MILPVFCLGWLVRPEALSLPLTLQLVWGVLSGGPGAPYVGFQFFYQCQQQTGEIGKKLIALACPLCYSATNKWVRFLLLVLIQCILKTCFPVVCAVLKSAWACSGLPSEKCILCGSCAPSKCTYLGKGQQSIRCSPSTGHPGVQCSALNVQKANGRLQLLAWQ